MLQESPAARPLDPEPVEPPILSDLGQKAAPPVGRIIDPAPKTVSVFLAEEQQILKEAYISFFNDQESIQITGSSDDVSTQALVAAVQAYQPDVMLLGVKAVQKETVRKLEELKQAYPKVAIVLLFVYYDV
jgi:hypothetical protein